MLRAFLPVVLAVMLCSCNQEQFDVSSLSLVSDSEIVLPLDGNARRKEKLVLSAAFSLDEDQYSYKVISPEGELVWEGNFEGSGIRSAELEITDGARFPQGIYSYIFYSDQGTELSGDIEYKADESYPYYTPQGLSASSYVEEFDADGRRVAYGNKNAGEGFSEFASTASFDYIDRYGNRYSITQYVR